LSVLIAKNRKRKRHELAMEKKVMCRLDIQNDGLRCKANSLSCEKSFKSKWIPKLSNKKRMAFG
jgi:hypothetical protein